MALSSKNQTDFKKQIKKKPNQSNKQTKNPNNFYGFPDARTNGPKV